MKKRIVVIQFRIARQIKRPTKEKINSIFRFFGGSHHIAMAREEHYVNVSETYHESDNIFYERGSDIENWQLGHVLRLMELESGHTLADIGAGTGRFTSLVHSGGQLKPDALCVDPSEAMLKAASEVSGMQAIQADAVGFAESPEYQYDRPTCLPTYPNPIHTAK